MVVLTLRMTTIGENPLNTISLCAIGKENIIEELKT